MYGMYDTLKINNEPKSVRPQRDDYVEVKRVGYNFEIRSYINCSDDDDRLKSNYKGFNWIKLSGLKRLLNLKEST